MGKTNLILIFLCVFQAFFVFLNISDQAMGFSFWAQLLSMFIMVYSPRKKKKTYPRHPTVHTKQDDKNYPSAGKHISVLPVGQCMQSLIFIYGIHQTTFQAEGVLENCGGFISKN